MRPLPLNSKGASWPRTYGEHCGNGRNAPFSFLLAAIRGEEVRFYSKSERIPIETQRDLHLIYAGQVLSSAWEMKAPLAESYPNLK
jgi:hypothetical protein